MKVEEGGVEVVVAKQASHFRFLLAGWGVLGSSDESSDGFGSTTWLRSDEVKKLDGVAISVFTVFKRYAMDSFGAVMSACQARGRSFGPAPAPLLLRFLTTLLSEN